MHNRRSFTLVELLVTAAVGVLVITGVLMTIIHSMVLDEYNEKLSIAMNIARAQLEQVFSQRSNFSGITTTADPGCVSLSTDTDGLDGAYRIEVRDVMDGSLKKVKVLVCWRARGRIWGDSCGLKTDGSGSIEFKVTDALCSPLDSYGVRACKAPVAIETAIAKR